MLSNHLPTVINSEWKRTEGDTCVVSLNLQSNNHNYGAAIPPCLYTSPKSKLLVHCQPSHQLQNIHLTLHDPCSQTPQITELVVKYKQPSSSKRKRKNHVDDELFYRTSATCSWKWLKLPRLGRKRKVSVSFCLRVQLLDKTSRTIDQECYVSNAFFLHTRNRDGGFKRKFAADKPDAPIECYPPDHVAVSSSMVPVPPAPRGLPMPVLDNTMPVLDNQVNELDEGTADLGRLCLSRCLGSQEAGDDDIIMTKPDDVLYTAFPSQYTAVPSQEFVYDEICRQLSQSDSYAGTGSILAPGNLSPGNLSPGALSIEAPFWL